MKTGCIVAAVAAAAVAGSAVWIERTRSTLVVDSPAVVRTAYVPSDARLLDRHGRELHSRRVDASRRRGDWVELTDVSPALRDAVVGIEDRRFWQHRGVDWWSVGGSLFGVLRGRPPRGASTISMQLATLIDPTHPAAAGARTLLDKWQQVQRAWAIEAHWSKDEILAAYLNLVTFRGELQGVGAAAAALFNKAPHGLTEAEALVLAGSLRSPNASAAALATRAKRLEKQLGLELAAGDLAQAVAVAAAVPRGGGSRVALAPHLAQRLLTASAAAQPVRTTLDADLQTVAGEALREALQNLRGRQVEDGAVLVADNQTGDVLAYVGSSGSLSRAQHVDGVRARRQAGSALKPFLYGLAIEQRLLTAASLLEDTPLEVSVGNGLYRPQNYDETFRGLISVRNALAGSINVPAVRTIGLVGAEAFVQHLRGLGMTSLDRSGDYYGPSLALGSADVSLWELVTAYRTLANHGINSGLRLTPDEASVAHRSYAPATAFVISSILSDRDSRSTTFGLDNPLSTPFWTAVKTGTSKEMRDNWCIGYSQRYTVGVWVGNASGRPMQDVSGVSGAAPVWRAIMEYLHRDQRSDAPAPPDGLQWQAVAFPSAVEPAREEWFIAGTAAPAAQPTLALSPARIVSPVDGTIVALDPDISPARQRLPLEARGMTGGLRWQIDGTDHGPAAGGLYLWPPARGRHRIELVDGAGRRDAVTVLVRGR